MCIIAIKPKGKEMFSKDTLSTMFYNNPDGAGYMYYDNKSRKVCINKGFMTFSSLYNSISSKNLKDTNVVLHFRIGTSGYFDEKNCHPFPIFKENKTRCNCSIGMAHNGILHDFIPPMNSAINDTQVFITNVLNELNPNFLRSKDARFLIEKIIGTNRLAFLDDRNTVTTIGKFIEDKGYLFSNDSYRERKVKFSFTPKKKSEKKGKITHTHKDVYEDDDWILDELSYDDHWNDFCFQNEYDDYYDFLTAKGYDF